MRGKRLQHALSYPADRDLDVFVANGGIANVKVTAKDLKMLQSYMKCNRSILQGKGTERQAPSKVPEEAAVPKELCEMQNPVELCIDVMHVCKIPFLVTVSCNTQCRTCKRITKKGSKVDSFYQASMNC